LVYITDGVILLIT